MADTQRSYGNVKVHAPKDSEVKIEGELSAEFVEGHKKGILENLRKDFELPGFRKGYVPEDIFKKHVNDVEVWRDAAEAALRAVYPEIVEEHTLRVVGPAELSITKLAPANPVAFSVSIPVMPEIHLPNYKNIAKDIVVGEVSSEVSEKEVNDVIDQLRKMRIASDAAKGVKEERMPELTDEFVKTLGKFENVEEFKAKIKENLHKEKELDNRRRRREEIVKKVVMGTKLTLPRLLVEEEIVAMRARFDEEIKKAGQTPAEYLKEAGKTEEDLTKDQREYVERQFSTRFVFEAIIEKEHITVDEAEIEVELPYMLSRYPDIKKDDARRYVSALLMNEKAIKVLEGDLPASGGKEGRTNMKRTEKEIYPS